MSPNLSSGQHPPNKLLYEQVLFSMLSLVGVVRPTQESYEKRFVNICHNVRYINSIYGTILLSLRKAVKHVLDTCVQDLAWLVNDS